LINPIADPVATTSVNPAVRSPGLRIHRCIYLGAHNPLDVVGGLTVGTVLGWALNLALGVPRGGGRR
jgi:hypothetical protein